MCALIAMCCWDTDENKRSAFTYDTLQSLLDTVDFNKHRLIIVDNNSCETTKQILTAFMELFADMYPNKNEVYVPEIITLPENIGTAEAINKAWRTRRPGEHAIKMDNDVVIHEQGWVDLMEHAIERMPTIGIVGLKRNDLWECPDHEDPNFRSKLMFVPHERGHRWITFEKVHHVIGTCQMFSSALLDKIGYLYQPGLYGFDDSLAAYRCHMAGFISGFLPSVEITHLDPGGDGYYDWKQKEAEKGGADFQKIKDEYLSGERDIYYDPRFANPTKWKYLSESGESKIAKIMVVTTATDLTHPGLKQFVRSMKRFKIPYKIIYHTWQGYGGKILETYRYLKENPLKLTHFVYADSYDSFFLSGMQNICYRVKNWDAIMFQAEKACYPHPELADQYPHTMSPWKFLNGGGWVAPVDDFIAMVEADMLTDDHWNDQLWSTQQYLKHYEDGAITLDTNCDVFQSIAFANDDDFNYDDEHYIFKNAVTNTEPVIIHGNGHTDMTHIYKLIP